MIFRRKFHFIFESFRDFVDNIKTVVNKVEKTLEEVKLSLIIITKLLTTGSAI